MKVSTFINEIYSTTEVELSYKNLQKESVELIIEIPMKVEIVFNYFIAKIKDKIIKSKVIESIKAEEKYNDAIASGNTGIASAYDASNKICSLKIGNLPSDETLNLKFSFIQFVTIKDSFYSINLIKDFPTINAFNFSYFEGKIIIETNSEITDLIQKRDSENINYTTTINYSEEKQKCEIEYKEDSIDKILFKTKNMEKPLIISQYNKRMDEMNCILKYYNNKNEPNNNKQYPCVFIFLIDQSGSMSDTIKDLSKTLKKLVKSLPENSYYQLIGFGSDFMVYNSSPEKNTIKNLEKSYEIIDSLEANLGGTDLSRPLNYILNKSYSDYKDIHLSKQIIVLTDGDINIGDDIIELIKLHNNEFRIHTIGIGNNINKELIIKTSIAGDGTYHFISSSLNELDEKVFEILKKCTKEYINNYQFVLDKKEFDLQPVNKIAYNKESLNYCFIKKGNQIDDLNMLFMWENLEEKLEKKIEFKSEEIIKLTDGEELSKLIIGIALKYENIDNKKELSKLYQVLSDDTTLFAEIEGDKPLENNKITTFTKKFSFPEIEDLLCKLRPYSNDNSFKSDSMTDSKDEWNTKSYYNCYDRVYDIEKGDDRWCTILISLLIICILLELFSLYKK